MAKKKTKTVASEQLSLMDVFNQNLAELDEDIDFHELEREVQADRLREIASKAEEWKERASIGAKNGNIIDLSPEVQIGLAVLTLRALVVETVSASNVFEGVYRTGMIIGQAIKLLKAAGSEGGFAGWCQENGWKRSSMYRDFKLANHFGPDLVVCGGISENKLYACAVKNMSIEWVLENKNALISAKNCETVKRLCDGLKPKEDDIVDDPGFQPRTKISPFRRHGSWVVRIEGLTEDEALTLQSWNDALPGNQEPVVSNALDTSVEAEEEKDVPDLVPDDGKTNLAGINVTSVDLFRRLHGEEDQDSEYVATLNDKNIPLTSVEWEQVRRVNWTEGTTVLYACAEENSVIWESYLTPDGVSTLAINLAAL
jgi:hypothetical protein